MNLAIPPRFAFAALLLLAPWQPLCAVEYDWDPAAATGDWSTAANWIPNTGVPSNNEDQATIAGGGVVRLDLGGTDRIGMVTVGAAGTTGTLTVAGGTSLDVNSTAGGGGGLARVRVGIGAGSVGNLIIEEGAEIRIRGGNTLLQIGDVDGGIGNVTVAGIVAPFKSFELGNGTLTMQPTATTIAATGSAFNSGNTSTIGAGGTLAFEIDGAENGLLDLRTQSPDNTLLTIDPAANLEVTLLGNLGDYTPGQQWTLVSWDTGLSGQFAQGSSFVSAQGHTFSIDYAGGDAANNIVLTLDAVDGSRLEFTDITYDVDAGSVTVTWNSLPGRTYSLDTSTDLSIWTEVDDTIPSGGTSTIFAFSVEPGTTKVFSRVKESPQ